LQVCNAFLRHADLIFVCAKYIIFYWGVTKMTDERKAQVKSKIENIWYYYKWYIIVGALFIALAIVVTVQIVNRSEADAYFIVTNAYSNTNVTDGTCDEMRYFIRREYASDRNGDGEVNVEYAHYTFGTAATDSTNQQALTAAIYSTDYFLIICDETGYDRLKMLGTSGTAADVLEPLNGIVPDDMLVDSFCVDLSGTALNGLSTINEQGKQRLYACIRAYTGTRASRDANASSRYEYAVDILQKICADKG